VERDEPQAGTPPGAGAAPTPGRRNKGVVAVGGAGPWSSVFGAASAGWDRTFLPNPLKPVQERAKLRCPPPPLARFGRGRSPLFWGPGGTTRGRVLHSRSWEPSLFSKGRAAIVFPSIVWRPGIAQPFDGPPRGALPPPGKEAISLRATSPALRELPASKATLVECDDKSRNTRPVCPASPHRAGQDLQTTFLTPPSGNDLEAQAVRPGEVVQRLAPACRPAAMTTRRTAVLP